MPAAAAPRLATIPRDDETVLDTDIVRQANEAANSQIEEFAENFSRDFAEAAAALDAANDDCDWYAAE